MAQPWLEKKTSYFSIKTRKAHISSWTSWEMGGGTIIWPCLHEIPRMKRLNDLKDTGWRIWDSSDPLRRETTWDARKKRFSVWSREKSEKNPPRASSGYVRIGKKKQENNNFCADWEKNKVDFLFDLLDSFSCLNISDFAATTNSLFEKPPVSKNYTGFESNWTLFMSWGARKKAYKMQL